MRWLLPLHRQQDVSKAAKINLILPGTTVPWHEPDFRPVSMLI
jgi:hypothetical protein